MAVERIPQSVTKRFLLKAYLASDHVTAATGKTLAVVISQNGAAFGNPSAGATNATEVGSGWYYFDASTTDTGTAGPLIVRGTASGVDDVERTYHVVNAHNAGFDGVPAAVAGANGGLPLGNAAGRVDVGNWLGAAPNALQSGRVDSYLGAVAAGVIAAASFASGALDAVWSTATRLLTAGTNIVLAKGVGVTGFNDLSAAQVNAEADTALADVGLTGTVTGRIDAAISSRSSHTAADVATQITTDHGSGSYVRNTEPDNADITAIKAKTDNLPAAPAAVGDIPTVSAIADEVRMNLAIELAHLDADISSRSTYDGSDPAGVTTLLARLTATRAALLDNLANLDAAISAITLSSSERTAIADAYLDRVDGIETGLTPRQADRLLVAAVLAKASGMDVNAPVFRDFNDTKNRLVATCDEAGNRLSVAYDPS